MSEELTLKQREQTRLTIMGLMDQGKCSMVEAAAMLGLSERQMWRIRAAFKEKGVVALVHGNRGRQPAHRVASTQRMRIVDLAQSDEYKGCNQMHLTELLAEREGIHLGRSTVRRILAEEGIASPRHHKRRRYHRRRRERAAQAGMLLQMDASPHAWLEERGPRLSLHAAIDDATGEVHGAIFRREEDTAGYLAVLQQICRWHGVPIAVYHDRHTIFGSNKAVGIEDQLLGWRREPSQVGRALQELGIRSIQARSPQAKGRVERLFGTLQDRLVITLRLAGASSIDDANAILPSFLESFNAQFAVPALDQGVAYRPWPADLLSRQVFCFKYGRVVANDNTVRFDNHRLQLLPGSDRVSYAKCHVEVQEWLNGQLVVFYHGRRLRARNAPPEAPVLRARSGRRMVDQANSKTRDSVDLQPPFESGAPSRQIDSISRNQSRPKKQCKPPNDHPWRHP